MATGQQPPDATDSNIPFLKPAQVEAMRDAAYEGHHGARDDAIITLLHVSDDREAGETFLEEWAMGHGLEDAEQRVESGDIEDAIAGAADDATLVIAGASGRGLLSRLIGGSPVIELVDDVDCSVLLAERAQKRGVLQRLLGN